MAFPSLGYIDQFNRANETPLAGGWLGPAAGFPAGWSLSGNKAVTPGTYCASYWNTATFGPDVELYATVVAADPGECYFGWRTSGVSGSSYSGYQLGFFGADVIRVWRIDSGTPFQLGADISQSIASGDSVGIEMIGSTINVYYKASGGSWGASPIATRSDSNHTGAGHVWFGAIGGSDMDDVGGGTIVAASGQPAMRRMALAGFNRPVEIGRTGTVVILEKPQLWLPKKQLHLAC